MEGGNKILLLEEMTEDLEHTHNIKTISDSGTKVLHGRRVHYVVLEEMYEGEYQYSGEARDDEANVSVEGKRWQSAEEAREHILQDLVDELIKIGLLKDEL